MKTLTKILIGLAAVAGAAAGVTCLVKAHGDDENYVTTEVETEDNDSDSEEEAE